MSRRSVTNAAINNDVGTQASLAAADACGTPTPPSEDRRHPSQWEGGLLALCAVAVILPAVLPTLVVISPRRWFDIDPRSEAADVFTSIGPVDFAGLCMFGVGAAVVSLIVHVLIGGRVHVLLAMLTLPGAMVAWWHTGVDHDDLRYALAWSSAAMLGLAIFHLAQHDTARRWMVALLIASVLTMFTDAALYRLIEHPATVEHFERNKPEMLATQGMLPGSPAAELFERRLRTNDAVGPYGLSNVFGSVAGSAAVLALGLAWSCWREAQRGRSAVLACVTAAGAITVWLTNSSGAVLGVLAALFIMGIASWQRSRRFAGIAAVALVLLAIVGVLLRGMLGPPPEHAGVTSGASLSILFRAWYWLAGWRIWSDSATNMLLGTGVGGFGQSYLVHKHPLSPEEVTSAHNVFVDDTVMLGLSGLAWSATLLWALWRAGRHLPRPPHAAAQRGLPLSRVGMYGAMTLAALLFIFKLRTEQAELSFEATLLWLLTAATFGAVLIVALQGSARGAHVGLLGSAVVLLVHNQIEMTFFQPASVAWAWAVVMLAGGSAVSTSAFAPSDRTIRRGPRRLKTTLLLAGPAVVLLCCVSMIKRETIHQAYIAQAARDLRQGDADRATSFLRTAALSSNVGYDTQAQRWWLGLELSRLMHDHGHDPMQLRAEVDALTQQLVESVPQGRLRASHWRMLADARQQLAQALGDPQQWTLSAQAYEQAAALSPYNPADAVAAGEAWQLAGDAERAEHWFDKARQLNANLYLDPAKRVPVPTD